MTEPDYSFARRTSGMSASEVRALFAVAARPEVISLAGGMPFVAAFPREEIVEVVARVLRESSHIALQYGAGSGLAELRERLAELLAEDGMQARPRDVVITAGGQQALDVLGKIFIDKGDPVVVEAPSYVGALSAFSAYEPAWIQIPVDDDGMIVDELEEAINHSERRPKFVYTVPNFHNPAGVTMSLERREKLVTVCRDAGIPILEDDPYRKLRFDGESLPTLYSIDPESVIHLSSLSKIFAPGLRIGYVVAQPPVLERFVPAKEGTDLCPSNFAQLIAAKYLSEERWKHNLTALVDHYRARRDACLSALDDGFPAGSRWTRPAGGFYVWVTLPYRFDTPSMLDTAIDHLVAYVPGTAFYPDGRGRNQLRLAFSLPPEDRVAEGVRRLAEVFR